MTQSELVARFRNLLIVLSRHQTKLLAECAAIRAEAKSEPMAGRRAGLNCKANALAKEAMILGQIIRKNGAAMRHFFNTSYLPTISAQEIQFYKRSEQ